MEANQMFEYPHCALVCYANAFLHTSGMELIRGRHVSLGQTCNSG
jgi:hypothetical protein